MRYTVTWLPQATDQLIEVWLQAPDRQAVTAATYRIDRTLRIDPDRRGEEYNGDRIHEDWPLLVTFHVHPDDRLVEILGVWHL